MARATRIARSDDTDRYDLVAEPTPEPQAPVGCYISETTGAVVICDPVEDGWRTADAAEQAAIRAHRP